MKYVPVLHVVLFQPEIPPNTGNIARTCVATACKLWLVKPLGFRIDEKELRRAGLDYWPHLDWEVVEDWAELTSRLHEPLSRGRIWLLTKHGVKSHVDGQFQSGDVLVFGRESSGLPSEILAAHPGQTLRVPMRPEVRSLNLSSTAAVVIYEALRQFGGLPIQPQEG